MNSLCTKLFMIFKFGKNLKNCFGGCSYSPRRSYSPRWSNSRISNCTWHTNDYKLEYAQHKPKETNKRKKRSRNITWFNPPYSSNITTNIGKQFFKLLDKCFPPGHQLHKLLNRNTVKLSYSCMPNMKQIISAHNKSIIKKAKTSTATLPAKHATVDPVDHAHWIINA